MLPGFLCQNPKDLFNRKNMKQTVLILGAVFCTATLFAQEPADALRFSWTVPGGTARQQAIGGAMGSLGGDITATFINPAGLAFYRTGDLTISPIYQFGSSKSTYLDRTERRKENNFTLGTTGFVMGSGSTSRGRNAAFSIAFNRTGNFKNNLLYRGSNNQSSYSEKFLEEIKNNGTGDANIVSTEFPYGSSLAFNTFWIDTVGGSTNGNFDFQSRSANLLGTGLLQEQKLQSWGGINEFALGFGVSASEKLMLGGSLGVPVLNYERESSFTEADATSNGNNKFDFATFSEKLNTKGVGLNVKAGLIFKPIEYVRLGLAFHSPTLYTLIDNFTYTAAADVENGLGLQTQSSEFMNDEYDNAPGTFRYMLATPYRFIASASYVIREVEDVSRQRGFITADLEYVNYKASSYMPDSDDYFYDDTKTYLDDLNEAIDNAYKSAVNFKVGGELKFTTFMLRAGAAYYGNPYQNINNEKGSRLNLSGGIGYRNKGMFADLTYVHAMTKDVHVPYRLLNSPYSNAQIRSTASNVMMTLGFKF